ncbi:hypothetical protein PROFUN_11037, partial [Planoprotostelium fungivorum]
WVLARDHSRLVRINGSQTLEVQFSVLMRGAGVFPSSQSVLSNKETTDSMHSDQGSKIGMVHFGFLQGERGCLTEQWPTTLQSNAAIDCVEAKEMGTSMFVMDAQMIAYFQEDKGSSLEPEAESSGDP